MPVKASFTNAPTLLWVNLHRDRLDQIDEKFLTLLANSWITHFSRALRVQIAVTKHPSLDDLGRMRNMGGPFGAA
jgi:hypothetical protein